MRISLATSSHGTRGIRRRASRSIFWESERRVSQRRIAFQYSGTAPAGDGLAPDEFEASGTRTVTLAAGKSGSPARRRYWPRDISPAGGGAPPLFCQKCYLMTKQSRQRSRA